MPTGSYCSRGRREHQQDRPSAGPDCGYSLDSQERRRFRATCSDKKLWVGNKGDHLLAARSSSGEGTNKTSKLGESGGGGTKGRVTLIQVLLAAFCLSTGACIGNLKAGSICQVSITFKQEQETVHVAREVAAAETPPGV